MFSLPSTTQSDVVLTKKELYSACKPTTVARALIDAEVDKLAFRGIISPRQLPQLQEADKVKAIALLQISLKQPTYSPDLVLHLNRLIQQTLVFALTYAGRTQLAIVFEGQLFTSAWLPTDDHVLRITEQRLDALYHSFIEQIGGIERKQGRTLQEQVAHNNQQRMLQKQIADLTQAEHREQQPMRKFALHQQILALKKQLDKA